MGTTNLEDDFSAGGLGTLGEWECDMDDGINT
jgi:hypothetical protein